MFALFVRKRERQTVFTQTFPLGCEAPLSSFLASPGLPSWWRESNGPGGPSSGPLLERHIEGRWEVEHYRDKISDQIPHLTGCAAQQPLANDCLQRHRIDFALEAALLVDRGERIFLGFKARELELSLAQGTAKETKQAGLRH